MPIDPVPLDLSDFDAVGVAAELIGALREGSIEAGADASVLVPGPDGWHDVVVIGRPSGHVVLSVRYGTLTASRLHNVAAALEERGWLLDDDGEGATQRFPPGTEAATIAFELLAVAVLGGAPRDTRLVIPEI
jgi:hypothetical protein